MEKFFVTDQQLGADDVQRLWYWDGKSLGTTDPRKDQAFETYPAADKFVKETTRLGVYQIQKVFMPS